MFTPAANANGAGYASFTFQVQDDGGTANGGVDLDPTPRTMTINVTAVNDAPVLGNNTLTIAQGGSLILSSANLSASDVDTPVASLTFTVSNLSNGRFELVASPGVPVSSFTQAAIGAGQVRFVQNGSASAPSYDVAVSDGTIVLPPSPVTLGGFALTPVAALTPPPVIAAPAPVQIPVVTPAPQPVAPAPAPSELPSASPPEAPSSASSEPPPAPTVGEGGPILSAVGDWWRRPLAAKGQGGACSQYVHARGTETHARELEPFTRAGARRDGSADPGQRADLHAVWAEHAGDLDASTAFPRRRPRWRARPDPDHHGDGGDGGIALSVGVVWWASRVGGLIGSLLASMPAWRHLDPLPIVGRDEEEEQWDETQDADADADELAVSMVLEGGAGRARARSRLKAGG